MHIRALSAGYWILIPALALFSHAQTFDTGRGSGTFSDTPAPIILAPAPVRAGETLAMARLPLSEEPPQIGFSYGTSGRYGPYPLTDNTPVGHTHSPYILRLFDVGQHFTLQAPHATNTVYGPFPATNGAPVVLGQAVMTVLRFPPHLEVSLTHPARINQLPLIGIAPYTPALQRELVLLRAKYLALANRVDAETADVAFQGVPRVTSRRTGNIRSPVVSPSQRDKQNTVKGAELSAILFLETLFQRAFRIRSQSAAGSSLYQFGMPPGDYLFCAMQKVRDPQATGVTASATVIWWTAFTFDGEHPLTLALTAENAITWREVFTFERE